MNEKDYALLQRFKEYFEHDNNIIDKKQLKSELLQIYSSYKIKEDMTVEQKVSQEARRRSYLSALKKRMKRQIVTEIVFDIVKYYDLNKTTYHFFSHICEHILGRNVDNRYILNNFSNLIYENNKFKKLDNKRNASEKMKLDIAYTDLVSMSHKEESYFRKYNFELAYCAMLEFVEDMFLDCIKYSNINKHDELDALIAQYELSKILTTEELEDQKIEPRKKKRL